MPFYHSRPGYASWIKRVVALLLDGAISAGTTFLMFGDQADPVSSIDGSFQESVAQGMPMSGAENGWFVCELLLFLAMQAYWGVTPGKLVMGIAVVGEDDGRPVGLLRTLLRWLAHIIDSILLIGFLRPLWNEKRKTFADSIIGTIVLDTRRPRAHRWLARDGYSSLDPGPPYSWVASSPPAWWPAATVISAVLCVLGILFTFGPSSEPTTAPIVVSCVMTSPDKGPVRLNGGTLRANSGKATTTRLGVTRDVRGGGGDKIEASWNWSTQVAATSQVRFRSSFVRADGTGARHYDYALPEFATLDASIPLPSDALNGLGKTWTWTQTVLVDGVESPGCTASVDIDEVYVDGAQQ